MPLLNPAIISQRFQRLRHPIALKLQRGQARRTGIVIHSAWLDDQAPTGGRGLEERRRAAELRQFLTA